MDRVANFSKRKQTRAWMHEMPCGDRSHKHENATYEAAARAICRLSKTIVARKVDGVYRESPEHRGSVTDEMVAIVNGEAVALVKQHEQRKSKETETEEVEVEQAKVEETHQKEDTLAA